MSFIFVYLNVNSQGIQFEHGSWASVQQKAKVENKGIFVDAYTDWCLPCKRMTSVVFPDSVVGEYFNDKFVNFQLDMEKGEGIALAKKYDVTSFPTYLYFDNKGAFIGKVVGYKTPADFISSTKDVLSRNNRPSTWREEFENSNKTLKDVLKYSSKLSANNYRSVAIDTALFYFNLADDSAKSSPEGWNILKKFLNDYNHPAFSYFIFNENKYEDFSEKNERDRFIDFILSNPPFLRNRNLDTESELMQFKKVLKDFADVVDTRYYIAKAQYFLNLRDDTPERFFYAKQFLDMTENRAYKDPKMFYYLVYMANQYKDEDGDKLDAAIRWAKRSIELNNSEYKSKFVLAQLLYREKNYKEALQLAIEAQALEKETVEAKIISELFSAEKIPIFIEKVKDEMKCYQCDSLPTTQ